MEAVQVWLVKTFRRWGPPERLRVDNGWPWGSGGDLPTVLALWLWGLGCELIWNRPGHPQENGTVERFHGLLDAWGEPGQSADCDAWARQVEWVVHTQRSVYPAVNGRSREEAYPELEQNPRRLPAESPLVWDIERVRSRLAKGQWRRQVDKVGQISLYHRTYGVGRVWAGQEVHVRFDGERNEWVVLDKQGTEIARRVSQEICPERILRSEISHLKPHEQHRTDRHNIPAHLVT